MKSRFLDDAVISKLDAYQTHYAALVSSNESKDEWVSTTAHQLQSLWEEHILSMGLERQVSLSSSQSSKHGVKSKKNTTATSSFEEEVEEWKQIAMHIVNCAVAAVVSGGKEKSTTAALSLMELIAQWAWLFLKRSSNEKKSVSVRALLDQILAFSMCPSQDAVRVLATQTMGVWSTTFWKALQSSVSSSSVDRECVTNILDSLQAALLPRFTDKAVAVRAAAVTAGIPFYASDPDLRQAAIWILQHDPSPSNRCLAVQAVPFCISTMDAVIVRLRDVKMQVRLAVLEKLQNDDPSGKGLFEEEAGMGNDTQHPQPNSNLLTSELMAEIVLAGYTDRCTATKEATQKLVALTWMKAVRYDPVALLRRIGILYRPKACETVIQAITTFPVEKLEKELSAAEINMYQSSIRRAIEQFSMHSHDPDSTDPSSVCDTSIDLERLFLARTLITQAKNIREKEDLMGQIVPDIPRLCQILESYATKLVQLLAGTTSDPVDQEEEEEQLVSICTQLLALATAIPMEEGSRRVFTHFLKNMLTNILTPDDLMEPALLALHAVSTTSYNNKNDYLPIIVEIVETISHQTITELQVNYIIRILSILTIVLETVSTQHIPASMVTTLSQQHVVPNTTHENDLIREAAVSCLGKLGFFTDTTLVRNDYKPRLMNILTNSNENIEIRAQSMLAICDWSMLFVDEPVDEQFRNQIQDMMERVTYPLGVRCMAAEIATKLLFSGKVCDSHWLATLLLLYFDDKLGQNNGDDREELGISDIGSPVRLQQLLSVFFPAYCAKSKAGRDAMTGSVGSILQAGLSKAKRRLPTIKILDYITATVELGRKSVYPSDSQPPDDAPLSTPKMDNQDDENNRSEPESSPGLLVSVQVATFLSEKAEDLNSTNLRALCKFIAGIELVIDNELWEHLSILKELLEELGNIVDDTKALGFLEQVSDLLVDVEMDDEVPEDDEESDTESLTEAFGTIGISSKENDVRVTTANNDGVIEKDSLSVPERMSLERSQRRQRRLLSSN